MDCTQIYTLPNWCTLPNWRQRVERCSSRERLLLFVVFLSAVCMVLFICLYSLHDENVCDTDECIEAAYYIIANIDQTVDPCEDFYEFACGKFLKTAIENNQASSFDNLGNMWKRALKQLVIEDRPDEPNLSKSFRNQRKFFRACMNRTAIDEDEDKTFLENLKYVIGGWPLSQGYAPYLFWPDVTVKARKRGILCNFFVHLDLEINYNGSMIYLEVRPPIYDEDHLQAVWKEANIENIAKIAKYWGNPSGNTTWEMKKTIQFAKDLSEIVKKAHKAITNSTSAEKKIKLSKMKGFNFPTINWLTFLKNLTRLDSITEDDVVLFSATKEYFKDLYYLLQKTETKYWGNYVAIQILLDECRYLSKKVEKLCLEIVRKSSSSRQNYCVERAVSTFYGVAEAQYVRKIATSEKRTHITEMINIIKNELENNLKANTWMDQKTKDAAVKHLHKIKTYIGWTDLVFNETEYETIFGFIKVELPDNILKMYHCINKRFLDLRYSAIKQPFSLQIEHAFSVPMLEENAFYVRYRDLLILEAPILHQPVYDINRPEYLNYGSLGSIIGHELAHAFFKDDKESRIKFGRGSSDYWTEETHRKFDLAANCIIEEYERYSTSLGITLKNSSASLDENFCDFTGVNVAYMAYQTWVYQNGVEKQLPGLEYTPNQLFWIMVSTFICTEPKLSDPEKAYTYPKIELASKYAIANFRLVGPVRNSPYFGKDFGCPLGRKMNPEKKCRVLR